MDYLHDKIQYIIDENLRTICIPQNGVVLGVVGDKNTNRVNFQMPRWYNGFDMSTFECQIHYINANGEGNYYTVNDLTVENDNLLFTWLVESDATSYEGYTTFVVKMFISGMKDGKAEVIREFNTTLSKAKVLPGMDILDPSYVPGETPLSERLSIIEDNISLLMSELNGISLALDQLNGEEV